MKPMNSILALTALALAVAAEGQATGSSETFPAKEWEEAMPQSQGVDPAKLREAIALLDQTAGKDGARELVLVRNGRLIWKGPAIDKMHGVWSCTKSFTSTVLGLLIEDGKCALDTRAAEALPELAKDYRDVTLRHFTTMTSGYRADGDERPVGSYRHGPSKTPFVPMAPLFTPPGSRYAYWDSAMNLFGLALTRIAGEPMEDLFRRRIAEPIGMGDWDWGDYSKDNDVVVNGGSGNANKHVFITARAMARFGLLFLNKGNWNGRQLISRAWVEQATRVQVPAAVPWAQPESEIDGRGCYGFNWWVNGLNADGARKLPGAPPDAFWASGANNNRCFVIPQWNMVIVRLGLDGKAPATVWSDFLAKVGEAVLPAGAQPPERKTTVGIQGDSFLINNQPTCAGRRFNGWKVEGLLMNSRMVQGIFDDRNPETRARWNHPDGPWDPERNTREFIAAMPAWRAHGLLSFTINLQGGSPEGYSKSQPWHNSAFESDGRLRPDYMARLECILDKADELGMAPIVGFFYFGQAPRLANEAAVIRATESATDWLLARGWRNVMVEIANECNHSGYPDIIKPPRAHELIELVRKRSSGRLLVSTSLTGGKLPTENIVKTADFLLLHGNGVRDPDRIRKMVEDCRAMPAYRGQPILFNEDDHFDFDKPDNNMLAAVSRHASWGYFDFRMKGEGHGDGYQSVPVNWAISSPRKRGFFELLGNVAGNDVLPPTVGLRGKALSQLRREPAAESLKMLRGKAEKRLTEPLVAVTDKKVASPSGNPHDYVSLGRYWWPNPKTANGLPYVQRDGEVNPENDAYDRVPFERMTEAVEQLSLAWFLTGESRYAERAARQLRVWFLDDATRMTPHLKHAQLIKGINDGRGVGLIDVRGLTSVVDSEALLRGASAWQAEDHDRLVAWFRDYFKWLTTSKHGQDEAAASNNHGTWYDVQAATIALFIGDTASARQICEQARARRIAKHIEPDGRQPLELRRTLSFGYTLFNLDGLFRLARLGEHVGVDLWHYRTDDGRSIRAALDWVLPFATGKERWSHKQISKQDFRPLVRLLRQAARVYNEPAYEKAISELPDTGDELLWVNLFHPRL